MRSPVLLLAFLTAAAIAPAQDPSARYEGRMIARIEFDPPSQPLPRTELDQLLPFRVGSTLQRGAVRAAIDRLYQTGRYTDISVDASLENEAVVLKISTGLAYFVSGVTISGVNEPPNKGQLVTATKLELGAPFVDSELEQASQNIMDRLRANGLYQASIKYSMERRPDTEEVDIHFNISSGQRARFDGVNLSGNFTQSPESIIRETRWRRGLGPFTLSGWREATENRIQNGVRRVTDIFQRGDRLEARVTLNRLDYNGATNTVTPALVLDSGPPVEVRTIGTKVSSGKLRQLIPIYQERSVDRSLLLEGQRNLLEYFQSQGYFEAQVDLDEAGAQEGRQTISYRITPNARDKLVDVSISGNQYFDRETLRERMAITTASFPRYRFGRFSERQLGRDLDAILDLYHANGFRDVDVTSTTNNDYEGHRGHLAVFISVREGPQWLVGKLAMEGVEAPDLPYLRSLLQSAEGQPFSEANVAADRDAILNFYYNNGYPDAAFDWEQTPGAAANTMDLTYTVRPGRHEYIRGVLIRGLEKTRPGLVSSRIQLAPGDPVSAIRIAESQQKLYDLGIFSKVETALQNPDGDEESKYAIVRAEEADRYSFTVGVGAQLGRIGAGVTTFDEPAGTTGFVPRISLGVTRLNLWGDAHTVSLQTRFSTIEQRAVLSYIIPQALGNENLTFTTSGLFDNSRDIRTFAARRWEGSMQLAQRLSRANSVQYRFTFRHVTISDLVITPGLVPLLSQPDRVGMLSMTFIQDRRDNPIDSHRGVYNTIDAGISLKELGSETVFSRLLFRNSTYHPITRNVVIARTLQFGYIQRIAGVPDIPLPERFFGGGASSDRAFPDNQAGPRDLETGFPLGGNALLFHSTELRFPLIGDNVGGVLFHDMGNVYDELRDINVRFRQENLKDFDYMVQSFGFGIRYRTPIGPLRVDFSLSPDAPRFFGFKGTLDDLLACGNACPVLAQKINVFQFHFSLGQTF